MNIFTNGRLVDEHSTIRNENVSFNDKFRRGDYSPTALYRQPDQLYGSSNHINNQIGRIDYTKPLYRAESNFDLRTPLQKCEVNNHIDYLYKFEAPSIDLEPIKPLKPLINILPKFEPLKPLYDNLPKIELFEPIKPLINILPKIDIIEPIPSYTTKDNDDYLGSFMKKKKYY